MVLAQQPQIVIRAVHDQLVCAERLQQRGKIDSRQRVNQPVMPVRC